MPGGEGTVRWRGLKVKVETERRFSETVPWGEVGRRFRAVQMRFDTTGEGWATKSAVEVEGEGE